MELPSVVLHLLLVRAALLVAVVRGRWHRPGPLEAPVAAATGPARRAVQYGPALVYPEPAVR